MKTDHVAGVLREVHCEHCAASFETGLMPVTRLADMLSGFLLMHRRCEKPEEPSKQVALFDALHGLEQQRLTSGPSYISAVDHERGEITISSGMPPGIDASTDEPAPEIDPPGPALPPGWTESNGAYFKGENLGNYPCGEPEEHDKPELTEGDLPDHYAKFAEMYPMAQEPVRLTEQIHRALGNTGAYPHLFDAVAKWHPSSVAFQMAAAWARIECAHLDSEARGIGNPIAGLTIPACLPMPAQLQEALRSMSGGKAPKKKRKEKGQ